ncbi:hypothetical protein AGR1A_Cc40141 [Agrobacterium fabacearum CFBP 5771]|nr:hypothetical protein AGR1A_Cc40141 [Agrobacterium fabacearum CFBP 5771]
MAVGPPCSLVTTRRRRVFSAQRLWLAGFRLKAGMTEEGYHFTKSMTRCAGGCVQAECYCGVSRRHTASKLRLPVHTLLCE